MPGPAPIPLLGEMINFIRRVHWIVVRRGYVIQVYL